ncbi:hypothetical protein REPUB_Repub09cG0049400 [Reevesia pubescens]
MSARRHVRYSPLAADEDDGNDVNGGRHYYPRFDYSPKAFHKVPWKSIALAVFLLCLGCLLLFLSFFILNGHIAGLWPFYLFIFKSFKTILVRVQCIIFQ